MTILEGARRLVRLGEGLHRLTESKAAIVEITIVSQDGDPLCGAEVVPVSRTKLIELLHAEEQYVGERLARILGEAYKPR